MVEFSVPDVDYTRYSNRQLIAVPAVVLGLALLVLLGSFALHGTPVSLGIEFTGGTELYVNGTGDATQEQIEDSFSQEVESIQPVRSGDDAVIVTFQSEDTRSIQDQAESAGYNVVSVQTRSAAFGADSQGQALVGLGVAFLGMALLVFALFRTFIPSIAVVLSAFSDIAIPLALMNVFGLKLSLGTVAALLMLIGYSVDSDILLNNHVLRRRGGFYESTYAAMRTGVTMTVTSIVAMAVMTVVATLFAVPLLPAIGIVLVFGLCADLMNTYLMNVTLLRYYKFEAVAR